MKNLFVVTGASRGIGKALALAIDREFGNDENRFILIARSREKLEELSEMLDGESIVAACDLSFVEKSIEMIEKIFEKTEKDFSRYVLVNNAGIIEPIGFVGTLETSEIVRNINVNLTSALALTNLFLNFFGKVKGEKIIVNISSGAGRMPIVCWSAYCSSKAGMDMMAKVIAEENSVVKIFSVAPGIIETDMQKVIRSSPKERFPLLDQFVMFEKSNRLKTPESSAREIVSVIKNPDRFETIVSF